MITRAAPALSKRIGEGDSLLSNRWLRRACLEGQLAVYSNTDNREAIAAVHSRLWGSDRGAQFHSAHADSRLGYFKEHHADIALPLIREVLESEERPVDRIVDLGCGDGKVLNHLLQTFKEAKEGIGIDLTPSAIHAARSDFGADRRLSFIAANALDTFDKWLRPGTLVTTNGGVLEYFARDKVELLLERIAEASPSAVFLAEPLAPDVDLDRDKESVVFGKETSFSHNYPMLLENAGLRVTHTKIFHAADTRWILILAQSD